MTQAAMDNETMVAVTQADRDAADEQIGALLQGDGRERLLAGKMDSLSLVQAFARHRHQSGRTGAGEAALNELLAFAGGTGNEEDRIFIRDRVAVLRAALSQSTAGCPHEAWEDRGGNKCCVDCGLWFDDAEQSTAGEDGA